MDTAYIAIHVFHITQLLCIDYLVYAVKCLIRLKATIGANVPSGRCLIPYHYNPQSLRYRIIFDLYRSIDYIGRYCQKLTWVL